MVFTVILVIAVIGTSGYRYFASMDIRRSDSEITAGRIASQLCQSWKGIGGGASTYNPTTDTGIGLDIESASSALAPQVPLNFTLLTNGGYYKVDSEDRTYYVTMSYYTIVNHPDPNLETLNVIVSWPASGNSSNSNVATSKSISLSDLLTTH